MPSKISWKQAVGFADSEYRCVGYLRICGSFGSNLAPFISNLIAPALDVSLRSYRITWSKKLILAPDLTSALRFGAE